MYINQAVAAPNGFFGADMKGSASPWFGKKHRPKSLELMSKRRRGIKTGPNPLKARPGELNGMYGRHRSEDEITKMVSTRNQRSREQNMISYSRQKGENELRKIASAAKLNSVGSKNPRAKHWRITSPAGDVINLHGNFKQWCKQNNLPSGSPVLRVDGVRMATGRWSGWSVKRL
jgi:hypothetical protein